METKLLVARCSPVIGTLGFDQKLRKLRAISLMHSISAARTVLTAKELKDALRKTLDDRDRILVVEVSAGWASRRAENSLDDLLPPRGRPALVQWKQRWGECRPAFWGMSVGTHSGTPPEH
jgi:hypothetical protein